MSQLKKRYLPFAKARFILLAWAGLSVFGMRHGDAFSNVIEAEHKPLSCSNAQYYDYLKIMVQTGEMTIGRVPTLGTRAQQQKMMDAFDALDLPAKETVIAVGHYKSGKVYTNVCKDEKCTMQEMAQPEHVCLKEFWNDCTYLAMQFKERRYCFITPAGK